MCANTRDSGVRPPASAAQGLIPARRGLAGRSALLVLAVAAFGAAGCSTISTINSRPPGATVFLNGTNVGTTPVRVELDDGFLPGSSYTVRLEMQGYETKKAPLGQEYNIGWIVVDVICFGVVGGLIPAAFNGQSHRPVYNFDMVPVGGGAGSYSTPAYTTPSSTSSSSGGGTRPSTARGSAPAFLQGSRIAVLPTQLDPTAEGQVPDLFNDYVMAAVQEAGDLEVIGQDDINTLIGFEQQKDLLNCTDTSCIADIGGALGVDRIMGIKVARLGSDWVITAKLINIKEAKVESRVNDIVAGGVKDLLQAVPGVVANVFNQL